MLLNSPFRGKCLIGYVMEDLGNQVDGVDQRPRATNNTGWIGLQGQPINLQGLRMLDSIDDQDRRSSLETLYVQDNWVMEDNWVMLMCISRFFRVNAQT